MMISIKDAHLEHHHNLDYQNHLVAAPREARHVVGEDEREDAHVGEHLLIVGLRDYCDTC